MNALVLQSDFGLDDGAVSAMRGVALGVRSDLQIHDVTHNIPPYQIWEGSYRLAQVVDFWPKGTVFVSVVDPGVGSDRLSVVAKLKTGHYVVTPNNGTLTHLHLFHGVEELRQIDEEKNRREGSAHSYTFHGRDIYAYTGARLAAGVITWEEVGPKIPQEKMVLLEVDKPQIADGTVKGNIDTHDVRYGSLWTSIPRTLFAELNIKYGDYVRMTIRYQGQVAHSARMVYEPSFAHVEIGESLVYVNSLDRIAVAINRGSYAKAFSLGAGKAWHVEFRKDN